MLISIASTSITDVNLKYPFIVISPYLNELFLNCCTPFGAYNYIIHPFGYKIGYIYIYNAKFMTNLITFLRTKRCL